MPEGNINNSNILIIGRGQDGVLLEKLLSIRNINNFTFSRLGFYKNGKFINHVSFNINEIQQIILTCGVTKIFYTSGVQIGSNFSDSSDKDNFYRVNSIIPLSIIDFVNSNPYIPFFDFIYFSSCYVFDNQKEITIDTKKILDDDYKKSKNDFLIQVSNLRLRPGIKVTNLYLFPHDSPLKQKSLTNRIINSVKRGEKGLKINLTKENNLIYVECAYALVSAIIDYSQKEQKESLVERFIGGQNSFSLYSFLTFLLNYYGIDKAPDDFFDFNNKFINPHRLKNEESEFIVPISITYSKREFWNRLIFTKRQYLKNLQYNFKDN